MIVTVSSTSSTTSDLETKRVVRNRRWIHRNELKMGMYVQELDRPWEETSFMFQGFKVDSLKLLLAVQDASEYVLVETQKVARISTKGVLRRCGALKSSVTKSAYRKVRNN